MDKTTTPAQTGSSCASCRHLQGAMKEDKSMSWQCTRYPPVAIGAAQVNALGQVQWMVNGFFPPIGNPQALTCGEHELKGMMQ